MHTGIVNGHYILCSTNTVPEQYGVTIFLQYLISFPHPFCLFVILDNAFSFLASAVFVYNLKRSAELVL